MASRTRTTAAIPGAKPAASPPADVTWVNPMDNPDKANAEISALLDDATHVDVPVISFPADDTVNLPGGLIKGDALTRVVTVKELNGEDEEALARASQSMNTFHFIDRLLRCGVVQIGTYPPHQTETLLKDLLIGDREQLILGIRRATYGEEIEISAWKCTNCNNEADLTLELEDIPSKTLVDPENEIRFEVALRKDRKAKVKLASGTDQIAVFEKPDLTQAQRETILLSKCVLTITGADGVEQSVAGFPSLVRGLSIPDRHKILDELKSRQPGPRYDDIKYTCEACGEEVRVAVGLSDLFPDFGWF